MIRIYKASACLGWFSSWQTNASSLYNEISNSSIILLWNPEKKDFHIYVSGSPYDFSVKRGDGFFVATSKQGTWHGEG